MIIKEKLTITFPADFSTLGFFEVGEHEGFPAMVAISFQDGNGVANSN